MADFRDHVLANIGGAIEGIFYVWWDQLINANGLESPLEAGFLFAFFANVELSTTLRIVVCNPSMIDEVMEGEDYLALIPQAEILDYRADFLIKFRKADGHIESIVVECDGHEFHERTKEQAIRDRSRDRAMLTAGYKVFRFTGSELYADAWGCGNEIKKYIEAARLPVVEDQQ